MEGDKFPHRVEEIFNAVTQLDASAREEFLEETCAGDSAAKTAVSNMLLEQAAGCWEPDQLVDHYRILSQIGRGGMGQVYLAEDQNLGRKVAIKFLPGPLTRNADLVRRFIQEAHAASALNHPNIVTIHEFGETRDGNFLVMEFIQGNTLRAAATNLLPIPDVVRIALQIAKALSVAHAAGIIHRDIKPENIVLRDDGFVKILDFGLARLSGESTAMIVTTLSNMSSSTMVGSLIGTLHYMSPEQARGEELASATDIFSLGIVLYQLTTGKNPFAADTAAEVLRRIISAEVTPPSRLNPQITPGLETVILRSLEMDAKRRIAASEMEAALSRIQEQISPAEARTAPMKTSRRSVRRNRERDRLRSAFTSASAGHGNMLCVAGEAGSGKTTLVEDFIAEFQSTGQPCTVARGRCSERLAGTAYLPVLEVLESLVHEWTGSLAEMMKKVAPTWHAQVSRENPEDTGAGPESVLQSTSQERLRRELSDFFAAAARFQPLVLFFDDLHWADESTTDLLSYIADRFTDWPLLVVATFRQSDLVLAGHPFFQIKNDLKVRRLLEELELDFLTRDEVDTYLSLEFPGHLFPADLASMIHTRTGGNPLFMADLIRYLRARGVIFEENGRWVLGPVMPGDLPESVRSMIEKKIEQLSDADRQLLLAASVQGYQFDSAVVSRASGLPPEDVEDRLEDLDRKFAFVHLIDEQELPEGTPTLRYRFVHVLYQNALFALLKPARRTALSSAVAETLLFFHQHQTSPIALNLALLFETARNFPRAADFFLLTAQNAARLFAFQESVRSARRGLDILKRLPPSGERTLREMRLQTALGGPLAAIKGFTTAEVGQTYARARDLFQALGEPAEFFPTLFGQWAFYYSTAKVQTARDVAEQSLRVAVREAQPMMLLLAHHLQGTTLMHLGDFEGARLSLEQARAAYTIEHDRTILEITQQSSAVIVWMWSAFVLDCMGYRSQALEKSRDALSMAQRHAHPPSLAAALFYGGVVHQLRREPRQALEHANAAIALSEEHGFPLFLYNAMQLQGWARAALGEIEPGKAAMRKSLETLRAIGTEMGRPYFLAMFAGILLTVGDIAGALDAVDEGIDCVSRTGDTFHEPELHRLKAEIMLKQNRVNDAEAALNTSLDIARKQKSLLFELRSSLALATLLSNRGSKDQARGLLSNVLTRFPEGADTADLQEAAFLLS